LTRETFLNKIYINKTTGGPSMKTNLALIALLSLSFLTNAQAAGAKSAPYSAPAILQSGSVGGGSDGCGLGWQVTDKKTMLGTTTRGTTNGLVPPTLGMTSGTIGCDQHDIAKKEQKAATYVVANYQTLSNELAQGSGETVQGLAFVMGCTSSSQELGRALQNNYGKIGSAQNGFELYNGVRQIISTDSALSGQCAVLN
jgi:hypothetical protein